MHRARHARKGRSRDGQRDPDPDVRSACACDAGRSKAVSFRNPFGVTKGERLGPKFAIYEAVKVKQGHLLAGKRGMVIGYTKVDTYRVQIAGKMYVIAGEFLSPSKVKRSG